MASAPLMVGCPGWLDDPDRFRETSATCADPTQDLFRASCALAGCHGANEPAAGLDLASAGVEARLIGAPAIGEGCEGPLVEPGDADASVIYQKLFDPAPCGARMPLAEEMLSPEQHECVRLWIEAL